MLSQKCKYALRAILCLAAEKEEKCRMGLNQLAKKLKIPSPFLGKILQELVRKKIISSAKGPHGGFFLTKKNREINILSIVEAIDGLDYFTQCGLGLETCSDQHPCPLHDDFKVARNRLKKMFEKNSIDTLARETNIHRFMLVR
jgi:Rrf2 family protein